MDGTGPKSLSPAAYVDADGDGIPDGWEVAYGLTAGVSNAPARDSDSDGIPDAAEYVANTDPMDPQSFFGVTNAVVSNSQSFVVWFQSVTSRRYRLQWCTDLVNGPWNSVPGQGPRPGIDGMDHMTDTNSPGSETFYRVEVMLSP